MPEGFPAVVLVVSVVPMFMLRESGRQKRKSVTILLNTAMRVDYLFKIYCRERKALLFLLVIHLLFIINSLHQLQ